MYGLREAIERIEIWVLSHIFIAALQKRGFIFVFGDLPSSSDHSARRSLLFFYWWRERRLRHLALPAAPVVRQLVRVNLLEF